MVVSEKSPWGNDPIWRVYFSPGWFNHQLEDVLFWSPSPWVELLVSPTQELPKDVGCECSGSVDLDGGSLKPLEKLMPRWHPKVALGLCYRFLLQGRFDYWCYDCQESKENNDIWLFQSKQLFPWLLSDTGLPGVGLDCYDNLPLGNRYNLHNQQSTARTHRAETTQPESHKPQATTSNH